MKFSNSLLRIADGWYNEAAVVVGAVSSSPRAKRIGLLIEE